jgi:hypothetical protein
MTIQKKSPKVRTAIGLVALVPVVVVGILEFTARYGAEHAAKKLEAAQENVGKDRFAAPLTKDQVRILVGRPHTATDATPGMLEKQTYVWNSVFRSYTLSAYFSGDPKTLANFGVD